MTHRLVSFMMAALLGACGQTAEPKPCPAAPEADAKKEDSGKPKVTLRELLNHEVTNLTWWKDTRALPLHKKIFAAPPELSDYLEKSNIRGGYEGTATPAAASPELLADIEAALVELPDAVKALINPKLVGIYLVNDLGSSGFGEALFDENDEVVAGILVIDVGAMDRKANEWCTWKESSPFVPAKDGDIELVATIEPPEGDNRKNALQFILLHELSHIATIGTDIHPPFATRFRRLAGYGFSDISWEFRRREIGMVPQPDPFEDTPRIRYYGDPKKAVDRAQLLPIYQGLAKTDFATLYGSLGCFEDFAEALTTYVHMVLLKRPYRIELKQNDEVIHVHEPCWGQERCAKKQAYIEKLLAGTGAPEG